MQIDKAMIPAGETLRAQNDAKSLYSGSALRKSGAVCGVSKVSYGILTVAHVRAPLVGRATFTLGL